MIDLLIQAGPSIYGNWVCVQPPGRKTWPFRVVFTNGTWTAGNVILEELVGGNPVSPGPLTQYNPGQLTNNSQTGIVTQLGVFGPGSTDLEIDAPIEYIRARTDANIVGLVSCRLLEAA